MSLQCGSLSSGEWVLNKIQCLGASGRPYILICELSAVLGSWYRLEVEEGEYYPESLSDSGGRRDGQEEKWKERSTEWWRGKWRWVRVMERKTCFTHTEFIQPTPKWRYIALYYYYFLDRRFSKIKGTLQIPKKLGCVKSK